MKRSSSPVTFSPAHREARLVGAPARREARLVAFSVDLVVLAGLAVIFLAAGGLTVLLQTDWLAVDPNRREWAWGYAIASWWVLVPLIYFSVGARTRGTVGARLMGLRVRDLYGRPVTRRRAVARALLMYPAALFAGAGVVSSLLNRQGRPLHDRWSGTMLMETAILAEHGTGEGRR